MNDQSHLVFAFRALVIASSLLFAIVSSACIDSSDSGPTPIIDESEPLHPMLMMTACPFDASVSRYALRCTILSNHEKYHSKSGDGIVTRFPFGEAPSNTIAPVPSSATTSHNLP